MKIPMNIVVFSSNKTIVYLLSSVSDDLLRILTKAMKFSFSFRSRFPLFFQNTFFSSVNKTNRSNGRTCYYNRCSIQCLSTVLIRKEII